MLSAAFTYDWNDLHHQAISESHKATSLFARHKNIPGELRARYQEIYGLQRSLAGDDCLQRVNELWKPLFGTAYRWLQAQLALEKATCANLTLDFDNTARDVEISRGIARQFRFPELLLRVAGFEAGIHRWQEDYDGAWKTTVAGLRAYWQGKCTAADRSPASHLAACPYSWERLYQFYSVLQQCARKLALPHASEALLLRSMSVLEENAPANASLRAMLYLRLANILSQQGASTLAEREAKQAESILKEFPSRESTAQLYAAVTRIELAQFELSHVNAELALSRIEPLRPVLANQDDFVKLDFYTLEGEIYRRLGRLQESVAAFESGIQVAEGSLNNEQDAARLNWMLATARTYRGLTRSLLEQSKTNDALAIWELFQALSLHKEEKNESAIPETQDRKFSYPPLPAASQPHLIYATFEDGIQVWTVIGTTVRGRWLPIRGDDLARSVVEFTKQCANPSHPIDASTALYSMLLQPVIGDLPRGGSLAIELDESIWGLTFEAIRSPSGHYFGDEYRIIYSPGLIAETALRYPTPVLTNHRMLLVDASQSIDVPLPGHSEELAVVKHTFTNTKILGPKNVTPEEVARALAESSEFHFSGHGKRQGTGTALMLTSQLSLQTTDFTPQRLRHLQFAVLSACASGSAKKGALDQSNLVRSFLSGGVPNVIASRWDVDSRSTARFMSSFYGYIRGGDTLPLALQRAQADMRSINSHPYYWAAFTVAGRAN